MPAAGDSAEDDAAGEPEAASEVDGANTEVLGFLKKQDFPVGEYRWIAVVSPEDPEGAALVLEPNANPAGKTFQEALFAQRIPATAFGSATSQGSMRGSTRWG